MAQRWSIPFRNISNTQFTLKVYDDTYSGSIVTLTPATEPISLQYSQDDAMTPVQKCTGYLRVLDDGSGVIETMLPSSAFDRKVELYQGNTLKWRGYIQPSTYSRPWDVAPSIAELPLVSALTALESVTIGTGTSSRTNFAAFLKEALEATGYSWDNLLKVVQMRGIGVGGLSACELRLSFNRYNFLSLEQSDDRSLDFGTFVGQSYMSVLESICRYFAWTAVEESGNLVLTSADRRHNTFETVSWANLATLAANDSASVTIPTSTRPTIQSSSLSWDGTDHNLSIVPPVRRVIVEGSIKTDASALPKLSIEGNKLFEQSFPTSGTPSWNKQHVQILSPKHQNVKLYHYHLENGVIIEDENWQAQTIIDYMSGMGASLARICQYSNESDLKNWSYKDVLRLYLRVNNYSVTSSRIHPLAKIYSDSAGIFPAGGALALDFQICGSYAKKYEQASPENRWQKDTFGWSLWNPVNRPMRFALEIDGRWWDGTAWSMRFATFEVPCNNGSAYSWATAPENANGQCEDQKTISMPYNGAKGYIIPITDTIMGRVTLTVYDYSRELVNTVYEPNMDAVMLSGLTLQYFHDGNVNSYRNSLYYASATGVGASEDKSQTVDFTAVNETPIYAATNLMYGSNIIGTEGYVPVYYVGGYADNMRPEQWLLHQMNVLFGSKTRQLTLQLSSAGLPSLHDLVSIDSRTWTVIGMSANWASDSFELKLSSYE